MDRFKAEAPLRLSLADADLLARRGLFDGSARSIAAVAQECLHLDPDTTTVAEAFDLLSCDTAPTEWDEGMPVDGALADRYIVAFAIRFNWPPDVTRRQSLRDLRMLAEALAEAGQ